MERDCPECGSSNFDGYCPYCKYKEAEMRSIGKKNIRLIKEAVVKAKQAGLTGAKEIEQRVEDLIPDSVWGVWEGAYDEVKRVIWDEVMKP